MKREELIKKISSMKDDSGRSGCTYGDTEYDSLSVVYGYNTAIDNIIDVLSKLPQPTPTPEINAEAMLKHVMWQYANERFAIVHLIHELQRISILLEKIGADATYYKQSLEYLKGR